MDVVCKGSWKLLIWGSMFLRKSQLDEAKPTQYPGSQCFIAFAVACCFDEYFCVTCFEIILKISFFLADRHEVRASFIIHTVIYHYEV
jgi:hypothetical protein